MQPCHAGGPYRIRTGLQPFRHRHRGRPVVAHQHHVAARFERRARPIDVIPAHRGGGHVEVVTEHDALESQLAAEDVPDPAPGEPRGPVVQAFVHDVRGHDAREIRCGEPFEGHEVGEPEVLVRAVIDGKRVV